jgi:hypothetical protein
MATVSALIDLAEECFRLADREEDTSTAEALRETGLGHLEEAYLTWRQGRGNGLHLARA